LPERAPEKRGGPRSGVSWAPIALLAALLVAFAAVYELTSTGKGGGSSLGVVNIVGLASVVVGVAAAGIILRRSSPPA